MLPTPTAPESHTACALVHTTFTAEATSVARKVHFLKDSQIPDILCDTRMTFKSLVLVVLLEGCITAPVDDPIRIDLPVYDQPQASEDQPQVGNDQPQSSSNVQVSKGIVPENYPGGEPDPAGGNFISYKLQTANTVLGNTLDSKAAFLGPFAPPVTKIESAIHETEGLGSRGLSVKENLQSFVAGIFQPRPIVDTISESDKFGNTGDKFYAAGQVLVKGASGVSNFVNSILEIPGTLFKTIARSTTEKLNNVGGKLIGL